MLYAVSYMLYAICYGLYAVCYMLWTICCMLYAVSYMLYSICSWWCVPVQSSLNISELHISLNLDNSIRNENLGANLLLIYICYYLVDL